MTSMIDGIRLDRLAAWYRGRIGLESAVLDRIDGMGCRGCGGKTKSLNDPCPDCLRLVADTLRDAAGRADK